MKYNVLGKTNIRVSQIGMGTAEIGFTYGIGPRNCPTEKEAITLLKKAVDAGITFFDTAHFYGNAESHIAKSKIAKRENVVISTKCGHVLDRMEDIPYKEMRRQMKKEVEESLTRLQLETIPLVQVHGGKEEQIKNGFIQEVMQALKDEGKIMHVGISTRGETAPVAAIKSKFFETLQLAYNILDQRMNNHIFNEAKKNGLGIINRSVFLKGTLTPARAHLAPTLISLKENADEAEKIADDLGITLPTLALRFAISNPNVDTIIVGSNKEKNIKAAIEAAEAGPLPKPVLEKLYLLAITDEQKIDPKYWPVEYIADAKDGRKIDGRTE